MSRHVNNTYTLPICKIQISKAQFNGNTPLFLFDETVGIDAGEGFDKKGLAVVHMSGGADDHMFHKRASFRASTMTGKSASNNVRTSSRYRPS